ncbi:MULTISPECIES: ANTAR domain-containing protein [Paenibacillus]|uniref:hypothetical protein n=1 Tax=Paenibacillus TaxID=44249 RepID=UPI0022B88920|nr:hypothetical protein [Paenibacillus caseinilyticus]MCZ8522236.1 hypothetical protein [Paenibacillus caseinilyticus]
MIHARKPVQTLLLVTEDRALAAYIDGILERALGMRTKPAGSFAEAAALLAEGGFAAVLADVPRGTSPKMRDFTAAAAVPVLIVADEEDRAAARRAVEDGAVLYMIREGLTPDTLVGAVLEVLERSGPPQGPMGGSGSVPG